MEKSIIVLDLGSVFVKCGYAGEFRPRHIVPSPLAGEKSSTLSVDAWVRVLSPFLSQLLIYKLQCKPKERKILVLESMAGPKYLREAVAVVILEHLRLQGLYMAAGPSPALYCFSTVEGVVVDIGDEEAHVLAVYRGVPLNTTYQVLPLGVSALRTRLQETLGDPSMSSMEAQDIATKACLVRVSGIPSSDQVAPMTFTKSSGTTRTVSSEVRISAADVFFDGTACGMEGGTLQSAVLSCLKLCPIDIRHQLAKRIVVIGGGACIPGLPARLGQEIRAAASASQFTDTADTMKVDPESLQASENLSSDPGAAFDASSKVTTARFPWAKDAKVVTTPVPRSMLLWTGASIMGCIDGIRDRMITAKEYKERGGLPDWMSVSGA